MLKLGNLWIELWEPSDIILFILTTALIANILICLILCFRRILEKIFRIGQISHMLKLFMVFVLVLLPLFTAVILYKNTYIHIDIGFQEGDDGLNTIWITKAKSISFSTPYGTHWIFILLLVLWLSVFLFYILCSFVKNKRFMKELKAFSFACKDRDILQLQEALMKELEVKKQISLWECSAVDSPFVTGERRPEIFFPQRNISFQEKRLILQHELIHCKEKEYLYHKILFILCSLYWFSPFPHVFAKYYIEVSEMACDEQVLENRTMKDVYIYGKLLCTMGQQQEFLQNSVSLAGGAESLLEKRLKNMMKERKTERRITMALLTLIFIAVCPLTTFAASMGASEVQNVVVRQLPAASFQAGYINSLGKKMYVASSNGGIIYAFTVNSSGTYELVVENPSGKTIHITGSITGYWTSRQPYFATSPTEIP